MIERLLMSRTFRRYIEAWCVVLMPWVLFTEREGVEVMKFELTPEQQRLWDEGKNIQGRVWWTDSACIGHKASESTCSCLKVEDLPKPLVQAEQEGVTMEELEQKELVCRDCDTVTFVEWWPKYNAAFCNHCASNRDDFELTPEEQEEMDERRAMWMDSPLKFCNTGWPFPNDIEIAFWNEDDWRKSPTDDGHK